MLLVADSGSTKCDWILGDASGQKRMATIGFNPLFHTSQFIADEIKRNPGLMAKKNDVSRVYYYGASVSSENRKAIVDEALKEIFPNAEIYADHDLTGAAVATCNGEPGITCILGTGSNSCFFDGEIVCEKVPALGYILGDEASGAWFGKQLLKKFLYQEVSYAMKRELHTLGYTKEVIFEKVYSQPGANVFLASFMKFIHKHKTDPVIEKMLEAGFTEFLEIHVCKFDDYQQFKTHFVGSVGYYFQKEIEAICRKMRITTGIFTNDPITRLFEYHLGNGNR